MVRTSRVQESVWMIELCSKKLEGCRGEMQERMNLGRMCEGGNGFAWFEAGMMH